MTPQPKRSTRSGFAPFWSWLALVVTIAGCAPASEGPADDAALAPITTSRPVASEADVGSTATCKVPLGGGDARVECEEMSFDVSVPAQCPTQGCGLIVDVHGYTANGAFAERHSNLRDLGNDAGYVVVQPNNPKHSWIHDVDDDRVRAFMERLIDALGLDDTKVHMGGFSQGGWMTWRFVCNHSDLIASAAPIGAGASYDDEPVPGVSCDFNDSGLPVHEVDVLYVHGTTDPDVPFATAVRQRDLLVDAWEMAQPEVLAEGEGYRWSRWTNARGTVFEFIEHDWSGGSLGGHCYPGVSERIGCGADLAIHYGQAALEFYVAHPKNE